MMFFTLRASGKTKSASDGGNIEKILAIIEVMVMVFITSFLPALIRLGRPPTSLEEVWVELLVALLACSWTYIRIRGIDVPPEPE